MIIVIQCNDQVGLVAAITNVLANENLNIITLREYVDQIENLFFMRLEIEEATDTSLLEHKLKSILPAGAIMHINPLPLKKVVVMVTKEYHCLTDILTRNFFNTLGASVQCVIGNTPTCKTFANVLACPSSWYLMNKRAGKNLNSK